MSGENEADAFALPQAVKEERLLEQHTGLVEWHRRHCAPYARILAATGHPWPRYASLEELPWLPVALFKEHVLKSIPDEAVFRVLTSSGTTGAVSRVHLDRAAAAAQARTLSRTLRPILAGRRLPMLIVDSRATVAGRGPMSARGAGVLGLAAHGRDHGWLLDDEGRPDVAGLRRFLARHGDRPFAIFGFTFLVWQHLRAAAREAGADLSHGILVHSGGWKRLTEQAVDNAEFRRRLAAETGLTRVHNFYGMVEQIGTLFLEGPSGGSLYCPDLADVIIRDPVTWAELPTGSVGLIEVLSTLPTSYPGNVLLTEDLGVVHGIDDGDWPGKRFSVLGRLPRAEVRGCSDTAGTAAGRPR